MKIENWNGYSIRFVEKDGEWWAVLRDICDALGLKTFKVSQRLDPNMMERVPIEEERTRPSTYGNENYDIPSKDVVKSKAKFYMIVVNEAGIYETLFTSRKLEARKFRAWTASVLKKLRQTVGLEGYQIMQMTDPDVQAQIDDLLETIYWDEEKRRVMRSVTVAGGDVEQVPFD